MRSLSWGLFIALALAPAIAGAADRRTYVPVEQRFSSEQMKATGLDGLSPEQLALLNRLLGEEHSEVAREVEKTVRSERAGLRERVDPEPVRSALKGPFKGWSKGTVLELENGQRWRVTEGSLYLGRAVDAPKVTIEPGFVGAWYLQVEGQTPKAKVQRLD